MNCKECGQPLPEPEVVGRFENAWNAYGKKVDKVAAKRAWSRLSMADKRAVEFDITTRTWWPDPAFKPNFATYLNHRRWEDEAPVVAPDPNSGGLARRDVKEVFNGLVDRRNLNKHSGGRGASGNHSELDATLTPEQRAANIAKLGSILDGLGKIL
jgi:hypothetical protein